MPSFRSEQWNDWLAQGFFGFDGHGFGGFSFSQTSLTTSGTHGQEVGGNFGGGGHGHKTIGLEGDFGNEGGGGHIFFAGISWQISFVMNLHGHGLRPPIFFGLHFVGGYSCFSGVSRFRLSPEFFNFGRQPDLHFFSDFSSSGHVAFCFGHNFFVLHDSFLVQSSVIVLHFESDVCKITAVENGLENNWKTRFVRESLRQIWKRK